VSAYRCRLVEVTGGEPLLQAEAIPLMTELLGRGHEVLLETGGSLPIESVPREVKRIVDVKCPGSGEAHRNRWENLQDLRDGDEVKFVLAGREDYVWAREKIARHGLEGRVPILLSPVHGALDPGELARWVLDDGVAARLQIQLHKRLWPGRERGV
jgi:7-carboxy-7-deazaguanine synthase